MSARIGAAQQALCYVYRNPPASSGVRPQPYKEIARLIRQPQLPAATIRSIVRRFHRARQVRGRKKGWRKTTATEDARIFSCFQKIRRPLGSLVESQDELSKQQLCTEVLLTPLAARKVVAARDEFLCH